MIAKPKTKAAAKSTGIKPLAGKPASSASGHASPNPKTAGDARPAQAKPVKRLFAKRSPDRLERLQTAIQQVREGRRDSPRTARLLAAGAPKLAQKVVEEAAEVAIEAVRGDRAALVNESVDLLYNLAALWNGLEVDLSAIWAEMDRREAALGMAEKLPKTDDI